MTRVSRHRHRHRHRHRPPAVADGLDDQQRHDVYRTTGFDTACVSVSEPSPAVKATSTFGGSVTAASSTCVPSSVTTRCEAAVTVTVTAWGPVFRRAGIDTFVATAFRLALP